MAVDLEGYGRRSDAGQERAQEALVGVLDAAWAQAVPTGAVRRQPNGDGEVALLGAGIGAEVVVPLLRAIDAGLRAVNGESRPADRLRLRLAANVGRARPARNGFAGGGVVRTCRVLGSRVLRGELRDRPGVDLATALSEPVFAAVHPELPSGEFRRVLVSEPTKAFRDWVWLHVGAPLPALRTLDPAPREPDPTEHEGMHIVIADGALVGTIVQARELRGGLSLGREDP